MIEARSYSKIVLVFLVVLMILSLALFAASCGKKQESTSSSEKHVTETQTTTGTESIIDNALDEISRQINSVSPSDFNDSPLNSI